MRAIPFAPRPPSSSLRIGFIETIATLREVVLMPRDLRTKVPRTSGTLDVVICVHGFLASAGVFRPLKAVLASEGVEVASFTHAPGVRVETIASRIKAIVHKLPGSARVHLVGHSLGGLAARYYVQELGGHTRIAQTISLASPFHGTRIADALPFFVGNDLRTHADLHARIRAKAHEFTVPHTSIVAGADRVVVPAESAVFPVGDVITLKDRGHNALLYDPESIALVIDRIHRARNK